MLLCEAMPRITKIPMPSVPVIDISSLQDESTTALQSVGNELRKASQDNGFFYIAGHGIDSELIDATFDIARQFFSLPAEQKASVQMSGTHRGFLPIGGATMEGYSSADQKESFIWGLDDKFDDALLNGDDQLLAQNRWPNEPASMRAILNAYFGAAHECSTKVLRALAFSLGESIDYFTRNFSRPTSRGSLIYYPANASGAYGVSPHSDFGCLSLLIQGGPGLSAQTANGEWYDVDPIENTLVANIGDLLSRWTNGLFRSVPHCVVNKGNAARYSLVVFIDPDSQTIIEPIVHNGEASQFEPITCDAYISGRFNRSFAYRN